ncbi:MAG: acetyl-CoA synthetase [Acidimicrobiales bacterium]
MAVTGVSRYPQAPCLIGVGRRTWRSGESGPGGVPEPLAMWEEVARLADADTGHAGAVERIQRLDVVYCQSWQYDHPAERLADRLGAEPTFTGYSGIGGNVPQSIVSDVARDILSGDLDLALLVGGEALATRRQLAKEGRKPGWCFPPGEKRPFPFDVPFHPSEVAHHVFEAWLTFAMFENAHRARMGADLDEYRHSLGSLLAPMTAVAASNPYAWFPTVRGVEEIIGPTGENRMVGYPYSKLMTAIMDVDMAAAVLVASDAMADSLGVPADRRVYLRGWGYAEDPPALAQRSELWRSGAMAAACASALVGAGAEVDDIAHFDLYSCFASSVGFALDALGIDPLSARSATPGTAPERPVTVTGGLAYHGGPGSNYLTHSLATMVETLRADPGALGMVSGVGMHMNKHVFATYSTAPGALVPPDDAEVSARGTVDLVPVVGSFDGPGRVATYSVVHGRDGSPEWAALVCDVGSGAGSARCYARMTDPAALESAESEELIGRTVHLSPDGTGRTAACPDPGRPLTPSVL